MAAKAWMPGTRPGTTWRETEKINGPTHPAKALQDHRGQDLEAPDRRAPGDCVPYLSLESGRWRKPARGHLFRRPRRLRTDGARRPDLDQKQDRPDADLPPLVPRGRVRLLR